MADSSAQVRYRKLIQSIGRAGVHALFPNDFEYYMMALELVDSQDNTVDYLSFPVLPSSFSHTKPQITNIKKSAGGITTLTSPTFVPGDISLSGNFGRKLRFLIGNVDLGNISAIKFSTQSGLFSKENMNGIVKIKKNLFDPRIKTGYGVMKILEAICDKSVALDDYNQPMSLYFYNPAFGESFLVKAMNFTPSQSKESSNMIWQYALQLKTIAPLDQIRKHNALSMTKYMALDLIQKGTSQLLTNIYSNLNIK